MYKWVYLVLLIISTVAWALFEIGNDIGNKRVGRKEMKKKIAYYAARFVFAIGMMILLLSLVRSCINATGGWDGSKDNHFIQDSVTSVDGGDLSQTED